MINFTFPLLPMPKFVAQIVTENFQVTVIFCAILLSAGVFNLWRSAVMGYKDPVLARKALTLVCAAVVLAIFGVGNTIMVIVGSLLIWYVLWQGVVYWLIWRMLIRNILILWNPPAKDP